MTDVYKDGSHHELYLISLDLPPHLSLVLADCSIATADEANHEAAVDTVLRKGNRGLGVWENQEVVNTLAGVGTCALDQSLLLHSAGLRENGLQSGETV